MFCVFFAGFLKIIAPRVGFFHNFSAPVVGISHFLCGRGMGNSPFQKNSAGDGQAWNGLIHYSLKNVYKNATYLH